MSRSLLVLLATILGTASAFAQDSDEPTGDGSDTSTEASDDSGEDTSQEAPVDDPFAPPGADDPFATPGTDDPFAPPGVDDPLPADDGEAMEPADGAADPFAPPGTDEVEATMPDVDGGEWTSGSNVPAGLRIAPYGATTGIDVGQAFVLFANGGTNQTNLRVRYATGRIGVQVALPFVVHRLPLQPRDTGLGNLQLDLWYTLSKTDTGWTGLSVEGHANVARGARAYTWVHDADDIWPGTGLDLALQSRRTTGRITRMGRVALGVRGGRDYQPWASSYITLEAAAGADVALGDRIGIVGEASFAYWDLSPFDLTGLVRADISDGLRLRGGVVVPMGVWVGATGVDERFRGVREATALMDLTLAL